MFLFPVERSDQRSLLACAVVFSVLPACAVALRVLARRKAGRALDPSDYLIIAALVRLPSFATTPCSCFLLTRLCKINSVAYQGLNIACVLVGGAGWHVQELTDRFGIESGPETFIKVVWATSLALTKISILVLYCRIFVIQHFITVAWVTSAIVLLWVISVVAGSLLICQPTAFNWDPTIPGGRCGNSVTLWLCTGVVNIITDLVVLLLPMPYLFSLEMALYKRMVLMVTFGLGLGVVIISAIRLHSLVEVDMTDVTFTVPLPILWSALEPCLGITLACIPLLRPLFGSTTPSESAKYDTSGNAIETIGQKRNFGQFAKLRDDASTTQLSAVSDHQNPLGKPGQFRDDTIGYEALVKSLESGSPLARQLGDRTANPDIELDTITVERAWEVREDGGPAATKRNDH